MIAKKHAATISALLNTYMVWHTMAMDYLKKHESGPDRKRFDKAQFDQWIAWRDQASAELARTYGVKI